MEEELIKLQTWQILCDAGKSIDKAKAEYAYFNELYKCSGDFIDYLTHMRAVQLSYLIDNFMYLDDRAIFVEGMLFANKALNALNSDVESMMLTPKQKIHQIKEAYEEFKELGIKYGEYDEFDDSVFRKGIKKYVKRYCKKDN